MIGYFVIAVGLGFDPGKAVIPAVDNGVIGGKVAEATGGPAGRKLFVKAGGLGVFRCAMPMAADEGFLNAHPDSAGGVHGG